VEWGDFAVAALLDLETERLAAGGARARGAGAPLARAAVERLRPLFDRDGDGAVGRDEFDAFLAARRAGGAAAGGGGAPRRPREGAPASEWAEVSRALRAQLQALRAASGGPGARAGAGGAGGGRPAGHGSGPTAGEAEAPGPGGCAVALDPDKGEYLEVEGSRDLQFSGTHPFTIEGWFRPDAAVGAGQEMALVSKYSQGRMGQFLAKLVEGERPFFHREVAPWGHRAAAALPLGAFSHVAMTFGRGTSRIFVNGTLVGEQSEGSVEGDPQDPVLFGAMFGGDDGAPQASFRGAIDDLRLWSVERSQEEVVRGMHLALSGSEPGLWGHWGFDECAGPKAHTRTGAHAAVLHGGSWVPSGLRFRSYSEAVGCLDSLC